MISMIHDFNSVKFHHCTVFMNGRQQNRFVPGSKQIVSASKMAILIWGLMGIDLLLSQPQVVIRGATFLALL